MLRWAAGAGVLLGIGPHMMTPASIQIGHAWFRGGLQTQGSSLEQVPHMMTPAFSQVGHDLRRGGLQEGGSSPEQNPLFMTPAFSRVGHDLYRGEEGNLPGSVHACSAWASEAHLVTFLMDNDEPILLGE